MKNIFLILLLLTIKSFSQSIDYSTYNKFLGKYVSESGNVNYAKIVKNKSELEQIILRFEKFQPTDRWTRSEKLCFWINSYNLYTIKVIVDNYPVKSIKEIPKVWDNDFILSINKNISLSDIENKILRKMDEPRIHFAINCASISCPNLNNEAFTADKLEKQLTVATKNFINDKSKNIINQLEIKLSNIFDWFAADFKEKTTIIDFLNKYSKTKIDVNAKMKFMDYNWNLN